MITRELCPGVRPRLQVLLEPEDVDAAEHEQPHDADSEPGEQEARPAVVDGDVRHLSQPIRGQYPGHVITTSQSEASIHVT